MYVVHLLIQSIWLQIMHQGSYFQSQQLYQEIIFLTIYIQVFKAKRVEPPITYCIFLILILTEVILLEQRPIVIV